METLTEPKLAPPGAGLPTLELYVARALFGWRRWTGNRDVYTSHFEREREAIRKLLVECPGAAGGRRVLIPRVRGLEDSSRYWSVWMTLDHLRIVHEAVTQVISALSNGVTLKGSASTATVKPDPAVGEEVVAKYEKSCDALLEKVASVKDLKTKARYTHPWFGPLDAAGWHALAAGHISIHRKQIERIIESR